MDAVTVTFGGADELEVLESVMSSLAGVDPAQLPEAEAARRLRVLERVDAIEAASAAACWRGSTPRTGMCPTGSGPPGPGWST
jgi:hypothetical protein